MRVRFRGLQEVLKPNQTSIHAGKTQNPSKKNQLMSRTVTSFEIQKVKMTKKTACYL